MDISRLKKNDLKVWLPLFEDVEVLCCHIKQSQYDAIRKECTELVSDPKRMKAAEARLDEQKFRSQLGRTIVADWRGLEDDGEEYPCTPENIDYLMEHLMEFRLLVIGAPLSLEKMLAAERAETEKNSSATSAQPSTTPT